PSVVWIDVTCRAIPWARLMLESGSMPDDLNLKLGQRLSGGLVGAAFALLALGGFLPPLTAGAAVGGLARVCALLCFFPVLCPTAWACFRRGLRAPPPALLPLQRSQLRGRLERVAGRSDPKSGQPLSRTWRCAMTPQSASDHPYAGVGAGPAGRTASKASTG